MGSNRSRRRAKTKHPQHLPKAGTRPDTERLLHEEREAVLANIGLHPTEGGTGRRVLTWIIAAVAVLVVVIAILSLIALD